MLNNVIIQSGYISKYINSGEGRGGKWVSFSLYQKTGKDSKQYLPCVAYDSEKTKTASDFLKYVMAGDYVICEGRMTAKKDDQNRTQITFVVDSVMKKVAPYYQNETASPQPQKRATDTGVPMSKRLSSFDTFSNQQSYGSGIEISSDDLPF